MDDRRVHATLLPPRQPSIEIVRYERAGKWYWESDRLRKHLTIAEAAALVSGDRYPVVWNEGVPGGSRFDALVRQARLDSAKEEER